MLQQMSRRRLLIGATCVSAISLGGSLGGSNVFAMTVAQAEQLVRERETALRVAQRRYDQGRIPYANVQAREQELAEARNVLRQVSGGGSSNSNSGNSPSTNQSASSGDVARLEQNLRERETALRVAQERYDQGRIPYANVQARQREVDEARAALARATGGSSGGSNQSASPSSDGNNRGTVHVSNASQLDNACRNAAPNMRIVLANGQYNRNGGFQVRTNGNGSNPIRIEAANRGGATLGSPLTIYGNHVQVSGLTMSRATLQVFGDNCRVSRCTFINCRTALSARGASNIEIDYNEFRNFSHRGIDLDPVYGNQPGHQPYVHHNHLRDGSRSADFALGVGHQPSHTARQVKARIEYNLIENCDFDQIILLKCSDNQVRYNTVLNSGAIYVRHGRNNLISENYANNSKGIWLSDIGNEARNNRMENSQILVLGGDILSRDLQSQSGGFPRAENARLTNNFAHRTVIGRVFSRSNSRLAATGTVVNGHNGRIDRETQQNTQISNANASSAGNGARRVSASEVGTNGG